MTILLVTLASIIFTFLLYLAVNYKRVNISLKHHYQFGISLTYMRLYDHASVFYFIFFNYKLTIKVWDEIRDLPF